MPVSRWVAPDFSQDGKRSAKAQEEIRLLEETFEIGGKRPLRTRYTAQLPENKLALLNQREKTSLDVQYEYLVQAACPEFRMPGPEFRSHVNMSDSVLMRC